MSDTTVRLKSQVRTRECLGTHVENPKGESIGRIEDLMVDLHESHVLAAVVSFGGFLGLGDKLFAVPLSVMTFDPVGRKFILDVDKERLKDAPGFDRQAWPTLNRREWTEEIYSFYRFPPYWE